MHFFIIIVLVHSVSIANLQCLEFDMLYWRRFVQNLGYNMHRRDEQFPSFLVINLAGEFKLLLD